MKQQRTKDGDSGKGEIDIEQGNEEKALYGMHKRLIKLRGEARAGNVLCGLLHNFFARCYIAEESPFDTVSDEDSTISGIFMDTEHQIAMTIGSVTELSLILNSIFVEAQDIMTDLHAMLYQKNKPVSGSESLALSLETAG